MNRLPSESLSLLDWTDPKSGKQHNNDDDDDDDDDNSDGLGGGNSCM